MVTASVVAAARLVQIDRCRAARRHGAARAGERARERRPCRSTRRRGRGAPCRVASVPESAHHATSAGASAPRLGIGLRREFVLLPGVQHQPELPDRAASVGRCRAASRAAPIWARASVGITVDGNGPPVGRRRQRQGRRQQQGDEARRRATGITARMPRRRMPNAATSTARRDTAATCHDRDSGSEDADKQKAPATSRLPGRRSPHEGRRQNARSAGRAGCGADCARASGSA